MRRDASLPVDLDTCARGGGAGGTVPTRRRLVERSRRSSAHDDRGAVATVSASSPPRALRGLKAAIAGERYTLKSVGTLGGAICLFCEDDRALLRWRRTILEHLACWRQEGNTGDLVSEALSYMRERDLVPGDLQRRWLREQTRTLLRRTGLVAGRASLEFVHETLRQYLAGSALARSMSPADARARALLDDEHLKGRPDVLAFTIYAWATKGERCPGGCSRPADGSDLR